MSAQAPKLVGKPMQVCNSLQLHAHVYIQTDSTLDNLGVHKIFRLPNPNTQHMAFTAMHLTSNLVTCQGSFKVPHPLHPLTLHLHGSPRD